MKKTMYIICVFFVLLFITACNGANAPATPSSSQSSSPTEPEINREICTAYLDVLCGNQEFYEVISEQALDISCIGKAFTSDDLPIIVQQLAIIDLDYDYVPELVLKLAFNEDGGSQIGTVVLRYQNGQVYGYALEYRSFLDLKEDGTFMYSSGAADWGFGNITFSPNGYIINEISYCNSDRYADGTYLSEYVVDGAQATEQDFFEEVNLQDSKVNVFWLDFIDSESKNIEEKLNEAISSTVE